MTALLLSTHGRDLSCAKLILGQRAALLPLVERSPQLPSHLQLEAESCRQRFRQQPKQQGAPLQLVSDIDDTLFPSLHDYSGHPRGQPYPGVLAIYGALRPEALVFLTARPRGLARSTKQRLLVQIQYTLSSI